MTRLTMKTKGLAELIERFDAAQPAIAREIQSATREASAEVKAIAQTNVPKRTGATARRITSRVSGTGAATTGYVNARGKAQILERGAKPHVILPRGRTGKRGRKKALHWGGVFAAGVQHPGFKGRRFMERSREQGRPVVEKLFQAATERIVRKLGGR